MMAEVRVGIIGTGRHGTRYAQHIINDVAGLTLAAVSRRGEEGLRQAEGWGADYFADWRELVASDRVEAVIAVATPDLNPAIGERCVAAGKPLLVEKPLAGDTAAAAALVERFSGAGLPLTVGQTLRYNSTIRALRRELARVGELYSFVASQRLEPILQSWLDEPAVACGGVLLHSAVHLFDALRFITGREVCRVRGLARRCHTGNLEDLFLGLLELEGGVVGAVDASKVGPARSGRYEFVGSRGQLQGDQVHGVLEFIETNSVRPLELEPPASTIVPLLHDWHACITGAGPNPIPGGEGLAAVRICEACLRAAHEDAWVTIG